MSRRKSVKQRELESELWEDNRYQQKVIANKKRKEYAKVKYRDFRVLDEEEDT